MKKSFSLYFTKKFAVIYWKVQTYMQHTGQKQIVYSSWNQMFSLIISSTAGWSRASNMFAFYWWL